jgi:hypothetical protein
MRLLLAEIYSKKVIFFLKDVEKGIYSNRLSFRRVRNLSLFFVLTCLYPEGFPTRFACGNDISVGWGLPSL